LTRAELEGLGMVEAVVARHLMHVARQSGFEVRAVDCLSAYDWLTPEMAEWVRRTKHKSKYILAVEELLRIALLVEHGGLSVLLPNHVFPDSLAWLYDLLEQPLESLVEGQAAQAVEYCSSGKDAEVVLFYEKGAKGERTYEDWLIFARKESRLLRETFAEMS
jgi:hypothetical protein